MERRDRKAASSTRQGKGQPGRAAGPGSPRVPNRSKRISRAQREARRQRQLRIALGVAGAIVVLVLVSGVAWDRFIKPNQVVAEVNGVRIRRDNYWRYRSVELINQISSYQQFANTAQDQQQQQQYLGLATQASQKLDDLWGSRDVDDATVERMIEDQIYLQYLDETGNEITEEQVDLWINQQFAPPASPLVTPTPEPTLIPQRAAWATETAVAQGIGVATPDAAASPAVAAGTPGVASPAAVGAEDGATPVSSPLAQATPVADGVISPDATPETGEASSIGSPATDGTPVAETPTVAPTPDAAQALSTAEAGFDQYRDVVFDRAHMSRSDYERLIARPTLARELINAQLESSVPQSGEQVLASHILVDTQDLADSLRAQLNDPNVSFEQLAIGNSTDTSTAPNGGDLGWFTRGTMVAPFDEAAFSLPPGQISEPVQSEFGWHIIKVYEHVDDRAFTDAQYDAAKTRATDTWLADRLAEAVIESDIDPTPTVAPGTEQFEAPPDAPTPPAPTPSIAPAASPAVDGTPSASPAAPESATPVAGDPADTASPVAASPGTVATPVGTPTG